MLVTLNDLDIHSPFAGLFKCNPSHIYAAFYYISKKTSHHGWSKYAIDKSNVADVRHLVKPTVLNISAMRGPVSTFGRNLEV